MTTLFIYLGAALAEIAGCFAFWAWLQQGKSIYWIVPGVLALAVFAYLLTRINADFAGRAYAAYGGIYIASSLLWLWAVEGMRTDHQGRDRSCSHSTHHRLADMSELTHARKRTYTAPSRFILVS